MLKEQANFCLLFFLFTFGFYLTINYLGKSFFNFFMPKKKQKYEN